MKQKNHQTIPHKSEQKLTTNNITKNSNSITLPHYTSSQEKYVRIYVVFCWASCRFRLNIYAVFARIVPAHLKVIFQQTCTVATSVACTGQPRQPLLGYLGGNFHKCAGTGRELFPQCVIGSSIMLSTSRLMPSAVAPTCLKRSAVASTVSW